MSEVITVQLTAAPLNIPAAHATLAGPGVGGIDIFLGITRPEQSPAHGPLVALDYHAYEEMATTEMRRLASLATSRWPILSGIVWHRLGRVPVGDASVIIGIACAHRNDAFDACRFLIDELKRTVPIWKNEIFSADSRWQHPGFTPPSLPAQ